MLQKARELQKHLWTLWEKSKTKDPCTAERIYGGGI